MRRFRAFRCNGDRQAEFSDFQLQVHNTGSVHQGPYLFDAQLFETWGFNLDAIHARWNGRKKIPPAFVRFLGAKEIPFRID